MTHTQQRSVDFAAGLLNQVHRRLAGVINSGATWTIFLWLSALAMMLAGGYQLVQTLRPLL